MELPAEPIRVCLVGSSKFKEVHERAMREETLAGRIVLPMGLYGHIEGLDMDGPTKAMLDELHLRKIDIAHDVLVVSVNGYIGASTFREIKYAVAKHKRIRWLEDEARQTFLLLSVPA